MRHETAMFGQKNQIQKFQLSFFWAPFFSVNNKNHKNLLKPLFYSVLANLKKRMTLKQRNLKTQFLHPFFEKAIDRKLPDNWAQKKDNCVCAKNRLKPLFLQAKNNLAR